MPYPGNHGFFFENPNPNPARFTTPVLPGVLLLPLGVCKVFELALDLGEAATDFGESAFARDGACLVAPLGVPGLVLSGSARPGV